MKIFENFFRKNICVFKIGQLCFAKMLRIWEGLRPFPGLGLTFGGPRRIPRQRTWRGSGHPSQDSPKSFCESEAKTIRVERSARNKGFLAYAYPLRTTILFQSAKLIF